MQKPIFSSDNCHLSPVLIFPRGGGRQKLTLTVILLLWALFAQAQTPQTLCQQFGNQAANVTIGTPINQNQQSVTFLSTLYPNGATFQNQKIRINGILKVDRNLTFSNCRVELEGGAQIVTEGTSWILSVSSQFYSCGQMWQGIYGKTAGAVGIYYGQVEDAEAFLTLDDGAVGAVFGVTFNRNHIGIRNSSATLGVASVNFPFFGANTFDCTSALLPPFSANLSPSHTGTSYSGIYLNTAVGTFTSFQASFFRNMHFGIVLENADLSVMGCDFQNMITHPNLANNNNGIRIFGGALNASFCNFGQLNHGIWAEGAELNVNNCTFNVTGRSGITSTNNLNTDFIFVRNNTLTVQNTFGGALDFLKTGIRVDRNSRSSAGNLNLTSLDISANNITINGVGAGGANWRQQRGILVTAPFPSLDIGLISNNIIAATSAIDHRQNGIEVQAGVADRFRILGNNVSYNQTAFFTSTLRWGISMLFGTGVNHRLQNNNSVGLGQNAVTGTCAIHLSDMPNVTTCNNLVNNFEHGFHFYGPCNGLGFWQNTMNTHVHSVRVQNNIQNNNVGFIGTHTRTANRWNQAISATNNSTWGGNPLNQLIVPQNALPFSPTVFNPINFGMVAPGAETACIQPPTEGERELADYDKWVAAGASGADVASAWEEKRKLMYTLLRFPALASQDASVSNFYNAEYNTTLGKLAQAEYLFFSAVNQVTEMQNNNLSTLSDQRASLLEQLQDMDEANSTSNPTEVPSPAMAAAKQALLNTWKTNLSNRLALKQTIATQRQAPIQQAQQLLAATTTNTVQGQNWKTILGIRLNQALGVAPDETALNQLRAIAAQCPDIAGGSAIAAIYMLPEDESAQLIPHEEDGLSGNCEEPRSTASIPTSSVLKISPNPARDRLLVELPSESGGSWEVFDLEGRMVLTGHFAQLRTFIIQTGEFQNGIYLLSVHTSDSNTHFHKFLISK